MVYRKLGRTELSISLLGFGALEIGRDWPYWRQQKDDFHRPDDADAIAVIHSALDSGINFFDTAPAYGSSEAILGKALKGMRREVIIGTKCGEWFDGSRSVYDYSAAETRRFIENSMRQLQSDYIDLLQIHSANAEVIRKGETLSAMKEAQHAGKVRYLGISTDDIETALLAIDSGEYDSVQVSYNAINVEFAKKVFPTAQKKDIGIIVKDGMARGKLSAKYSDVTEQAERARIERIRAVAEQYSMSLSELAVRFIISHPAVASVIVGTKNNEHLTDNCSALRRGALPEEIIAVINEMNT
jgi:aryl-alcohol dehydrogenase-like predicted oxidoreductase